MLHSLSPGFRLVEAGAAQPLPADLEAEVEAVWREAVAASGGKLFNGVQYVLEGHDADGARVQRGEYRRFIAARRRPALAGALALRPLGVTGFTTCPDGVVMGRRAARLELGGLWEPAPAGTLDRLDARALVLQELSEELGLAADSVRAAEPRWLHTEERSGICDVVYAVDLDADAPVVRAAWEAGGTDEYDDVAVIPWVTFRASSQRQDFTALARELAAAVSIGR